MNPASRYASDTEVLSTSSLCNSHQGWASLNGIVQWPRSGGSESKAEPAKAEILLENLRKDVLLETAFNSLRRQSSRLAPPRASCSWSVHQHQMKQALCLVETMCLSPR